MNGSNGTTGRPRLRRRRQERILLGVCAGIAHYFSLDPTVVRVGFVVAGLLPPLGGALVLAYALMAVIVPEEGRDELAGREQVKENLSSLRSEVVALAEAARARVTGEPRAMSAAPPAAPVAPAAPAAPPEPVGPRAG